MAERLILAAEPRTVTGKQVKAMRRVGIIPAVIYGQQDVRTIQMNRTELRRVLRAAGGTQLIDINVSDQSFTVLAREIQQHATRGDILHVDFFEVNMDEDIVVDVELVPVGISPLSEDGEGTVVILPNTVQIQTKPGNLISEVEVDLSLIVDPSDTIQAKDLPLPDNVALYSDPEMLIANFQYQIEVEEDEEEDELTAEGLASIVDGEDLEDSDESDED